MERSYLLLLRYAVLNAAALAILAGAWLQGWLDMIWHLDVTRLSSVIALVFVVGWGICLRKVMRCSAELNAMQDPGDSARARVDWYRRLLEQVTPESHPAMAECLRSRLYARISVIRTISNNLVILGLIGTVIGFIIALGGVDAESVANVNAVAPMVSKLIEGMSVALF